MGRVPSFSETGEERTYTVAEVFPEYLSKESQVALRAYRTRENLTQKELSACTGIPQHHISEMENGKRPIGKERARKLAKNVARLKVLAESENQRIAELAAIVLEVTKVKPYKKRRETGLILAHHG